MKIENSLFFRKTNPPKRKRESGLGYLNYKSLFNVLSSECVNCGSVVGMTLFVVSDGALPGTSAN